MRVFYSTSRNVIVIATSQASTNNVHAPGSLVATLVNGKITIWAADEVTKIVSATYENFQNENNQSFTNSNEVVNYLNEEFNKPNVDFVTPIIQGLI